MCKGSWKTRISIALLMALFCVPTQAVFADKIVLVVKDDVPEFVAHARAIESVLESSHSVITHRLNLADESETLQYVVDAKPDLVYTIGTKSTQAMVRGLPTNIPIVYGLVATSEYLTNRRLMVGRVLEIPLQVRLKVLKKLFPHMNRVGVIEGPVENEKLLRRKYAKLSQEVDQDLFMEVVSKGGELQGVLNTLFSQRVDVVISMPKARIYNANDMRYLILFLSRYRVPYLALSPAYLDMGALLSIDLDMSAEATESAMLIQRVLKQPDLAGIPRVSFPTDVTYTINGNVLRQLRFRLSQEAIDQAKEIRE